MLTATEALQRLKEGNQRFVSEVHDETLTSQNRRLSLTMGQEPFAIILGCSDSRVPAEIVFDQGLGDLFVIRVAGNVVVPSLVGSIEFAAAKFHTHLVLVMGHTQCGAISATVEELERRSENRSPNLHSIVSRISPSIQTLLETEAKNDREKLLRLAVRANVRSSVATLRSSSQILEKLTMNGELMIVGAEYSLETGKVDFFDE